MPNHGVLIVLIPAFVRPALSCLVPSNIRFICWRGVTGAGEQNGNRELASLEASPVCSCGVDRAVARSGR